MDASFIVLFFGGPAIALVAFLACLFPYVRPQRLCRTLGALGVATSMPIAAAYLMNTGFPLLILRPGTAFLGLLAAISYLVLSRKLSLPSRQSTAAIALLVASVWDGVSLAVMMTPGFGGAYCQTSQTTNGGERTWLSLREAAMITVVERFAVEWTKT